MVYLDYAATTPDLTDYTALGKIVTQHYGNPSSPHQKGRKSRELIENARKEISDYFSCDTNQLIFTSGATESNNSVIKGWLANHKKYGIFCTPTAHHSMIIPVNNSFSFQNSKEGDIFIACLDENGLIDKDYLEKILQRCQRTGKSELSCFEWVNNETGIIQPAREVITLCHKYGAEVLVDAVQALPIMKINLSELEADYVSFSAHKIYGPKGIGLLYCKTLPSKLIPLLLGGNQEEGLRAGTENVIGILGFASAIYKLKINISDETKIAKDLQQILIKSLAEYQVPVSFNTKFSVPISPAILNLNCGVEGSALAQLLENQGYVVSTGAACSGTEERSHVLTAMGLKEAATTSIRVSLSGKFTTRRQLHHFAYTLGICIRELQG